MSRNDRKLKNLLIAPRFQFKLSLYYIFSGLVIITVMIGLIYQRLLVVQNIMNDVTQMGVSMIGQVNEIMFEIVQISLGGFSAFIIFSFVFALVISHRIAGPVVAIKAFIDELKKGNYDYSRRLRPRDELGDVMDALHELAPILKEKTGNK